MTVAQFTLRNEKFGICVALLFVRWYFYRVTGVNIKLPKEFIISFNFSVWSKNINFCYLSNLFESLGKKKH